MSTTEHNESQFIERRAQIHLSEEQMDKIADKVEQRIRSNFFESVGQTVFEKFLWLVGALTVGAYVWAKNHGISN